MSERGIIQGFEAKLSLAAVGRSVQALIAVRLRAHDREQIDPLYRRVPKLPAVLSTFHTSGSVDYLLHIAVATTEDLRDWVLDNTGDGSGGGPHRDHAGLRPHPGQPRAAAGLTPAVTLVAPGVMGVVPVPAGGHAHPSPRPGGDMPIPRAGGWA